MAMKEWSASDLEAVADDLDFVSQQLRSVAEEMRSKEFLHLTLQADAAFGTYRSTLVKVATDVVSEFRDQYRCFKTGELPRWKRNQKIIAARKAATKDLQSKGLVKKKAVKKPNRRGGAH